MAKKIVLNLQKWQVMPDVQLQYCKRPQLPYKASVQSIKQTNL